MSIQIKITLKSLVGEFYGRQVETEGFSSTHSAFVSFGFMTSAAVNRLNMAKRKP